MERINFKKDFKINEICAPLSDTSFAYNVVYFIDGFVYATDGKCIVRARIDAVSEGFSDETIQKTLRKAVLSSDFKKMITYTQIEVTDENIKCSKVGGLETIYIDYARFSETGMKWFDDVPTVFNSHFDKQKMSDVDTFNSVLAANPETLSKVFKLFSNYKHVGIRICLNEHWDNMETMMFVVIPTDDDDFVCGTDYGMKTRLEIFDNFEDVPVAATIIANNYFFPNEDAEEDIDE